MSLSFGRAALLGLGLAAASFSCVVVDDYPSGPALEFEGGVSIDFQGVLVGSAATMEIFAFNPGDERLFAHVEDFTEVPAPFGLTAHRIELGPKERKRLEFTMSPKEVGSFDATITFLTNGRERAKTIHLLGEGLQSVLVCTPSEVDVGDVVQGETRSTVVTCTNQRDVPVTIRLGAFAGTSGRLFAAKFPESDGTQVEIHARDSVDISVEFHAGAIAGAATATLPLLDERGRTMVSLPVRANAVTHALQIRTQEDGEEMPLVGCLHFPDTDLGSEEVRSVTVRNLSSQPVHLQGLRLDGPTDPFSIVSPQVDAPMLVPPGNESDVEIRIAFHPQTAGKHTQQLILYSDDDLAPVSGLRVCLEGQGGRPQMACAPSSIDFGPVAIGMSVTRAYSCRNSTPLRDGLPPQILYLAEGRPVETTDPNKFTAEIVNPDGSRGADSKGYHPGESFQILVTYTPGALESLDSAEVIINNHSSAAPHHVTQVVGQGRDLPPCVFDVNPPSLRFGVVAPHAKRTLTSYVINHLDSECIISGLRLSEATDPAFSMDEVGSAIVGSGKRFPITVTFAPTGLDGAHTGAAVFSVSDPANPKQSITLSGTSEYPCLAIDPQSIDFGGASPHCSGNEVFVTMTNICSSSVQLDDITIDEVYRQFVLRSLPLLPLVFEPGESVEFSVYLRPDAVGAIEGAVVVEVSDPEAPSKTALYTVPLKGEGRLEGLQTDTFSRQGKIDVLWVMDNSNDASSLRYTLHRTAESFMDAAIDSGVDFQVGVTTSGVSYSPASGCPGGFGGKEDGRLFPHPNLGRPRILKASMPRSQLYQDFNSNFQVGTCQSSSAMYEAARRALSSPWIHTPEAQGGNQGFLRNNAALSIVLVTNGDDSGSWWQGNENENSRAHRYVNFFMGLKPGRERSVKVHSISGGFTPCTYNGGAKACPNCLEGVQLSGGAWLDICSTNTGFEWDDLFQAILQDVSFSGELALRGQPADQTGDGRIDNEDIEVRVNGVRRSADTAAGARVWRYLPQSNSISFDQLHMPAAHHLVEVTYKVACFHYD